MRYADLKTLLERVCAKTFELEAPAGETRFIVISSYGTRPIIGDDAVRAEIRKVQLDICWQQPDDTLEEDVKNTLSAFLVPYSVQETGYDDDFAAMRTILQLEAL